jgi:hypothetical protein
MVEGAQGGQAAVDGGQGIAFGLAVFDEKIDILHPHLSGRFWEPGEEQLQIVGVMDAGRSVRGFAPQPFLKTLNFW